MYLHERVERISSYANTHVPATAAMSLPARLVGLGEDPGSEGVPVPAVSEAREYGAEALTLSVPLFNASY